MNVKKSVLQLMLVLQNMIFVHISFNSTQKLYIFSIDTILIAHFLEFIINWKSFCRVDQMSKQTQAH